MTEPLYGPPRVGGDILAQCTRCKMELAHVVVSMLKGRAARVICKTCKSTHNFKRMSQTDLVRSTKSPRAKKAPGKTYMTVSDMWEEKMASRKNTATRPYSLQSTFAVGEVIQHPNFGMGLVEEVKSNGKISVLFRNDAKTLIHGMAKPGGA